MQSAADTRKLSDVLHKMDDEPLSKLVHRHGRGKLERKIRSAS